MGNRITVTRKGHEAVGRRERAAALRDSMRFIGDRHHQLFKMLKFADAAVRRYGLTPRSGEPGSGRKYKGSYTEAKVLRKANGQGRRAIGESKPFVWSGGSRESARASRKVNATATSTRGKSDVIILAPAFNLTPSNGKNRIKVRQEFERVAEVERKSQETEGLKRYDRNLARTPAKKKTIGG